MGVGSSADLSGVTHITDVTKVEKELIVFDWTVLDFDATQLSFQSKSSTFTTGESLGRPSQWFLALNYAPECCGCVNIGLFLEHTTRVIDRPKNITARIDLSLLDADGKSYQEFGQITKTFTVPFFNGPLNYLDCHEWTHALDLDMLTKDKSSILMPDTDECPSLHIRLKMEIQGKSISSVAIRGPSWIAEKVKVHEDYVHTRALWTSKENSDCTIKCQTLSFDAHMNVLSSRSRIFATLLKPELKTRQLDKANGNRIQVVIPMDNMDAQVLEALLRYIYVGNLDEIPWNMDICSGLIKAAEQFELSALKNSCFIKMVLGLNASNAGNTGVLAHKCCATNDIKCQISEFIRMHWNELENMDDFNSLVLEQPLAFAFFHLEGKSLPAEFRSVDLSNESTNTEDEEN